MYGCTKQRARSEQTHMGTSQGVFPIPLIQSLHVQLVFCRMALCLPLPHHGFYHPLNYGKWADLAFSHKNLLPPMYARAHGSIPLPVSLSLLLSPSARYVPMDAKAWLSRFVYSESTKSLVTELI